MTTTSHHCLPAEGMQCLGACACYRQAGTKPRAQDTALLQMLFARGLLGHAFPWPCSAASQQLHLAQSRPPASLSALSSCCDPGTLLAAATCCPRQSWQAQQS